MSRALFIGRFQPFHLGHLEAVKWILEREEELIIGIGSAQYSYLPKNPFTAGERLLMVRDSLRDENLLNRTIITLIPDTDSVHSLWPAYVEIASPPFRRVYSNDPLTQILLRNRGYEVIEVPLSRREQLSGTNIRNLMARGDGTWRKLVPEATVRVLELIRGEERVKDIYRIHGLI